MGFKAFAIVIVITVVLLGAAAGYYLVDPGGEWLSWDRVRGTIAGGALTVLIGALLLGTHDAERVKWVTWRG